MKYKHYKKVIEQLTNSQELERLLTMAENDFNNITDSQYYNLKTLVLRKIYQ